VRGRVLDHSSAGSFHCYQHCGLEFSVTLLGVEFVGCRSSGKSARVDASAHTPSSGDHQCAYAHRRDAPPQRLRCHTPTSFKRVTRRSVSHAHSACRLKALLAANNLREGDILSIRPGFGRASSCLAGALPSRRLCGYAAPIATSTPALPGDTFITIKEIGRDGDFAQRSGGADESEQQSGSVRCRYRMAKVTNLSSPISSCCPIPKSPCIRPAAPTAPRICTGANRRRAGGSGTVAYLRDPSGKLAASYRVP